MKLKVVALQERRLEAAEITRALTLAWIYKKAAELAAHHDTRLVPLSFQFLGRGKGSLVHYHGEVSHVFHKLPRLQRQSQNRNPNVMDHQFGEVFHQSTSVSIQIDHDNHTQCMLVGQTYAARHFH
ncbi:MAG: hypothetical protein AAGI89_02005 [Pseudomonadota bacterium]